jgi:hypothetical protein
MQTLLGAGDIIDRSAQFYRAHLRTVLLLLVPNLAVGIALTATDTALYWLVPSGSIAASAALAAASVPALLVNVLTATLLIRLMVGAIKGPERGGEVRWRSAVLPMTGAFLAVGPLVFLGTVAFVVPGVLFFVWFAFVPVLVATGRAKLMDAFEGSRALSAGRFGAVLWRLAAPMTFYFLLQIVLILLATFLLQGAVRGIWSIEIALEGAPLPLLLSIFGIHELVRTLLSPLFAFVSALLYLALEDSATVKSEK